MKLELTDNELDYIIKVLGQRPWVEVNALILKLENQANHQEIQPPPKEST